ncbi:hypothetical protein [Pseudomonas cremoricolorata]|uniref:hypothetical protein n=1 Tax=Pseudomonas cremoricolorata TaxID=157783 RepID=UPI0012E0123B|nr:hypothetical protein [Pseudomonas cremoricolorata]
MSAWAYSVHPNKLASFARCSNQNASRYAARADVAQSPPQPVNRLRKVALTKPVNYLVGVEMILHFFATASNQRDAFLGLRYQMNQGFSQETEITSDFRLER